MEDFKVFCSECGKETEYEVISARRTTVVRGIEFSFIHLSAVCKVCGDKQYVPSINDENVRSREEAYRSEANLITISEIQFILDKYDIGAGPLAKLMDLGEVTINRYMCGQLPSRANSDRLREIASNVDLFESCLLSHSHDISKVAYSKCKEAIEILRDLQGKSKIEIVTQYLLNSGMDITPLALQKLLYYIQAFSYAFFRKEIFEDRCQAWAYGPVFPEVYNQYKRFGYNPIEKPTVDFSNAGEQLTEEDKAVINSVIESFGQYSGTKLRDITHMETPWQEARGTLLPEDRGQNPISKESIHLYFDEVLETHSISDSQEIFKYCEFMCKQ